MALQMRPLQGKQQQQHQQHQQQQHQRPLAGGAQRAPQRAPTPSLQRRRRGGSAAAAVAAAAASDPGFARRRAVACSAAEAAASPAAAWQPEAQVEGMTAYLDSLRWSKDGLVPVIVQHVDTGELLMQAYADRAALCETMQTRLATFYSRSRAERWCKGETSGNFIRVAGVFHDCDRDSLVYLGEPIGPACHTGARTCWFHRAGVSHDGKVVSQGDPKQHDHHAPLTTLLALEQTIQQRREAMEQQTAPPACAPEGKASWTSKLLSNPELLCKKVREEAGELCQTWEASEGPERAASEMADLLYHSMVLLNKQGVSMEEVLRVLRKRFGTSGVDEKASRAAPRPQQ